jgi:hypothetical protein
VKAILRILSAAMLAFFGLADPAISAGSASQPAFSTLGKKAKASKPPTKIGAANARAGGRHAVTRKSSAKASAVRRTARPPAAYPSQKSARAVALREAAARDAARAGAAAERPRAAPRETVESYRLDSPSAVRRAGG